MARWFPDCEVALEEVQYLSSFQGDSIGDGAGGFRSRLGLAGKAATAMACPEGALLRLYVNSSTVD